MNRVIRTAAVLLAGAALSGVQAQTAAPVSRLLSSLRVGQPIRHGGLTVFPLTSSCSSIRRYEPLDEAIRAGHVQVEEKGSGVVNTVRVRNCGRAYVFGIAGEIVSGAKQDRMLSEDILLSPGSGWLDVPVYCTEHGRWSGTSTKFATKGQVAAGRLRERAAKSGSQSEVWDEVGAARADLDIQSPGTAFARVYDDVRVQEEAERYMARLQNLPALGGRTCGVLVAVGERVVCVDAFGSVTLFSKMWPKLLRSYVIDAMSGRGRGSLTQRRAQEFLRAAAQGKVTAEPTAGAGQRHRITAANSSGSALAFGREVVHLDLFPDDGGRSGTDEGPAPSLRVRRDRSRD